MRRRRVVVLDVLFLASFLLVLARLVQLQVVEHEMWRHESERSTARFAAVPFERGWILDRHGEPLARTEPARDLVFEYRAWRRGSVAGQVGHAWWTLGAERPGVAASLAEAETRLEALGELTLEHIASLGPRLRRIDLGFYLERLFGQTVWGEVRRRLLEEVELGPVPLEALPGFAGGLAAARRRAAAEADAFETLCRVAGLPRDDVLAAMEEAVARAHARVDRAESAGGEEAPADPSRVRSRYRRRQELHAAFDSEPVVLARRVPYDTTTVVAIRRDELPGLDVAVKQRRVYPPAVADVAPLVVGRTGAPRPEDMERSWEHRVRLADLASLTDLRAEELDAYERLRVQVREVDYAPDEERGVLGVEAALEAVLRGKRGWVATRMGQDGVRQVESSPPRRGLNVTLTLDVDLQRACQEVLDAVFAQAPEVPDAPPGVPERWTGAIVLLDPRRGEVLAAASSPRPTREDLTARYGELLADPLVRLRHRALDPGATGNLPPPGSTFKPVSALAGLGAGAITPASTFVCDGELPVGDRTMGCLGVHGEVDLVSALAWSCNVYFYQVGRATGVEGLTAMARRFGFGRRVGLLHHNEALVAAGVPVADGLHESDPAFGPGPYTSTDAMRLAIGQAPLDDVTPLQVAVMIGAIGTGAVQPPRLVRSIEGFAGLPRREPRPIEVPESHLRAVRAGLAAVVDSPRGTARRVPLLRPDLAPHLAAKTGTAEVGGRRDHAWFAGYMPRTEPALAFCVLVEECGLHGSEAALPLFLELAAKPAMASFLREVLPSGEGYATR